MPRSSDAVIDGGVVNLDSPIWTDKWGMLKHLLAVRDLPFYWGLLTGGHNARPRYASTYGLTSRDAEHVRLNCTQYVVWYGDTPVAFYCRYDGWQWPDLSGHTARYMKAEIKNAITSNEES